MLFIEFLISEGEIKVSGILDAKAAYGGPVYPGWQWRTVITPKTPNNFLFEMYIINPTGEEQLAVQVEYSKAN